MRCPILGIPSQPKTFAHKEIVNATTAQAQVPMAHALHKQESK
jgi:hypothetical protein